MLSNISHLVELMQNLHGRAATLVSDRGPMVLALQYRRSVALRVLDARSEDDIAQIFTRFAADLKFDPKGYVFPRVGALSKRQLLINEGELYERMRRIAEMHLRLHGQVVPLPYVLEQFTGITNAVAYRLAGEQAAVIFDIGLVDFIRGAIDGIVDLFVPGEPTANETIVIALLPDLVRSRLEADDDAMWLLSSNLLACLKLNTTLCAIKKKIESEDLSSVRDHFFNYAVTWVVAHEFAHIALGHVQHPDHEFHDLVSELAETPKDHMFEHQADMLALSLCIGFARQQGDSEDVPIQAVTWLLTAQHLLNYLQDDPRQTIRNSSTHPSAAKRLAAMYAVFPQLCLQQDAINAESAHSLQQRLNAMLKLVFEAQMMMMHNLYSFHPCHGSAVQVTERRRS